MTNDTFIKIRTLSTMGNEMINDLMDSMDLPDHDKRFLKNMIIRICQNERVEAIIENSHID